MEWALPATVVGDEPQLWVLGICIQAPWQRLVAPWGDGRLHRVLQSLPCYG